MTTNDELEKARQEALADAESHDPKDFMPGSFGCHEALHATSILLDSVGRHLLCHPTILHDPEFYALADQAHAALFDLYQAIGAKHLEEEGA
ncbi:hypothetical protein ATN84_10365 [Paramesorhizobium deserti]|uniref:Uncharacterized protein n=1 Tax=Paramesorhizobium deserti TaxID=1494590 RepID=A0A135HX14_9HYPH|nr:hypothetical protein [Paramesorhizobium deserti]KXF77725.1 hypothetical protein ATN84_10365 [Paramesorhizobium deserti]